MVLAILGALAVLATSQPTATDQSCITTASSVRLRRAPSTGAPISAELPLGTELVVLERTSQPDSWSHVRADDGREGWIFGSLTAPFDREHRDEAVESIVIDKLSSNSRTTFSVNVQLFDLIERTAAQLKDGEALARFALYRLRSMSFALHSVPFRQGDTDPYRTWIREHEHAALYNEPAGQWMVAPEYVMEIHKQFQGTDTSDDIAWFFVQNGFSGECEGDVPCYVASQNELNGEYLRLHPRGRHADESNTNIALALNGAMDNLRDYPAVLAEFDPKTRCSELHTSLDP